MVPLSYLPAPKPNIVFYTNWHPLGFTLAVVIVRVYPWHGQ